MGLYVSSGFSRFEEITKSSPVNGAKEDDATRPFSPGVNAGANTACGGKDRKRPYWMVILRWALAEPVARAQERPRRSVALQ